MLRQKVKEFIVDKLKQEADLDRPADVKFGDYSTNIALKMKRDPKEIASKLSQSDLFEKVEVAGPGFINFYLSPKILYRELAEILVLEEKYGSLTIGQGRKIQVEFISANPTGPLTVANARLGPYGDVLANVLRKAGWSVEKAYYVNDCGRQVLILGHSVLRDDQAAYRGEYIDVLAEKLKKIKELNFTDPDTDEVYRIGQAAAKYIIKEYIAPTTEKINIRFDEWIFESDLYESGKVDESLKLLAEKDLIYGKDGARWFRATRFGDGRDRVVVKSDGAKTYLAADIALHRYKFEDKKFDKVINIWGADHHGDVAGLLAGVEAIGHKKKLKIILLQFVTVLEKGEKKRMSKRAGVFVALDDLLCEIGADATRFFSLQKSPATHLNFDLALAKEQSSKNPVYYVQYAHARIHSILRKAGVNLETKFPSGKLSFQVLSHLTEMDLIKQLVRLPEIVEDAARDYQVQRLPAYALELANSFHKFYENCRVIDEDKEVAQARIGLVCATKIVLKNTLDLMGISAPEKM